MVFRIGDYGFTIIYHLNKNMIGTIFDSLSEYTFKLYVTTLNGSTVIDGVLLNESLGTIGFNVVEGLLLDEGKIEFDVKVFKDGQRLSLQHKNRDNIIK